MTSTIYRAWGGWSVVPRRTIRKEQAHSLRGHGGQSKNETRTTSTAPRNTDGPYPTLGRSASNLCHADSPRVPGGRPANTVQQNTTRPTDRTTNVQEQAMNWTNTWLCALSMPTRRIVRQVRTEQLEPKNEKLTPHIHPWISQTA
jgi:hypothetical protein